MSEIKIYRMAKYFASGTEFGSLRTASTIVTNVAYKSDHWPEICKYKIYCKERLKYADHTGRPLKA